MQEEKKLKPAYPELYNAVLEEYHTTDGMSYSDVKNGIKSSYIDKVRRYIGEDKPAYIDTAESEAVAKFFEKKWQNPYNRSNKH